MKIDARYLRSIFADPNAPIGHAVSSVVSEFLADAINLDHDTELKIAELRLEIDMVDSEHTTELNSLEQQYAEDSARLSGELLEIVKRCPHNLVSGVDINSMSGSVPICEICGTVMEGAE